MNSKNTLHITFEFGTDIVGGIGTVVNELYSKRKENERFMFLSSREDNSHLKNQDSLFLIDINELDKGLNKCNIEEFIPGYITDIVIHSFMFFKQFELNFESYNIHYVIHSMPDIEKLYNVLPDEYIQSFTDGLVISDSLIVVSEYEKKRLYNTLKLNNLDNKKVSVIYNGIKSINENNNSFSKGKELGYIGRIDGRKGILNLLKRMNSLPNYNLKIAGGGLMSTYVYNQLIAYNGFLNNIDLLGFCIGERKKSFFKSINYLIIPSVYEPFGITVLESIQHGVIPIIPSYGGPVEIMGEDYPYQFNPNKDGTLEEVLRDIEDIKEKDLMKQIKKNYEILNKFSVDKMVDNYRSLIERK